MYQVLHCTSWAFYSQHSILPNPLLPTSPSPSSSFPSHPPQAQLSQWSSYYPPTHEARSPPVANCSNKQPAFDHSCSTQSSAWSKDPSDLAKDSTRLVGDILFGGSKASFLLLPLLGIFECRILEIGAREGRRVVR